jgi:hypothetical protein
MGIIDQGFEDNAVNILWRIHPNEKVLMPPPHQILCCASSCDLSHDLCFFCWLVVTSSG